MTTVKCNCCNTRDNLAFVVSHYRQIFTGHEDFDSVGSITEADDIFNNV